MGDGGDCGGGEGGAGDVGVVRGRGGRRVRGDMGGGEERRGEGRGGEGMGRKGWEMWEGSGGEEKGRGVKRRELWAYATSFRDTRPFSAFRVASMNRLTRADCAG